MSPRLQTPAHGRDAKPPIAGHFRAGKSANSVVIYCWQIFVGKYLAIVCLHHDQARIKTCVYTNSLASEESSAFSLCGACGDCPRRSLRHCRVLGASRSPVLPAFLPITLASTSRG